MSRPLVPVITLPGYSVRTWATDANYPAGGAPWNGQPTKVEPPGPAGGFLPGQGAAPSYFNKLFSDGFTTLEAAKTFESSHASEVQTGFTNLYDYAGQLAALNMGTAVSGIGALRYAVYEPVKKKWYVVGGSANCRSSATAASGYNVETLTGAAGTEACVMIDADPSGNLVISIGTERRIFAYNAGASTWAKVNMAGGGTFNGENTPQVAYDPVRALWCVLGYDSIGAASVGFTSPDRATWTLRSGPTFTGGGPVRMACKKSTGRLVAMCVNGATVRVGTSDDGGVSWTDQATLTTAVPTATEASLAYNPTEGAWLYTVGEVSGTPSCEVWRSLDDGVSWTLISSLANNCLLSPAAMGTLWLACVRTSSELAYSVDGGVTWYPTGFAISATGVGCFASANQFLTLCTGNAYPGLRVGKAVSPALT